MRRAVPSAVAIAVLLATGAHAAPPPPPDIPACDAPSGAESVARQYQTMQLKEFVPGELKVGPVKDLGIFPSKRGPYETDEMFVKSVRYCEAAITLKDGTVDQAYWRIQLTFNVRSWLTPTTFCSLKRDVWQNKCKAYRPEGAVPDE